jgi:hypothetical protein
LVIVIGERIILQEENSFCKIQNKIHKIETSPFFLWIFLGTITGINYKEKITEYSITIKSECIYRQKGAASLAPKR